MFGTWWKDLPADVEVCAIQLPGREARWKESPSAQLPSLVQHITEAMRPQLGVPYALFGHSVGALIAFEIGRELRRRGAPQPRRLFVSARSAPQLAHRQPPLHRLGDEAFVEALGHRYGGIPDAVLHEADLMRRMLPALRADVALLETYVYADEEPLECPISAFGGLQDPNASHDDLAAWGCQTRGAFSVRMFAGDHFFLKPARSTLLQSVSDDLKA